MQQQSSNMLQSDRCKNCTACYQVATEDVDFSRRTAASAANNTKRATQRGMVGEVARGSIVTHRLKKAIVTQRLCLNNR